MKPRTKKILNFALIFGTLLIVMLIGFSGQEMGDAITALRSIGPGWIVLCVLSWAGYILMDAFSTWFFLRRQGYRIGLVYSLFVAITGIYYSNVTPGATGGQPMQVYYLKKRGVPIGIGTSTLTVKFFSFQFMLAVLGTVLWIGYRDFIARQVGSSMWILVVGYVYNLFSVGVVLLMAVNKNLVRSLLHLVVRLVAKLRLIKDPDAVRTKAEDVLETFHASVMMLARRPLDVVVQLLFGALQLLSLMAVIPFVYQAFSLAGQSYGQLTALGIMLYTSAAYTPLPGASGAQEGIFALYFAQVFPDGIRVMALLLWRFFTYYLSLLVGAVVSVVYGFVSGRRKEKPAPPAP